MILRMTIADAIAQDAVALRCLQDQQKAVSRYAAVLTLGVHVRCGAGAEGFAIGGSCVQQLHPALPEHFKLADSRQSTTHLGCWKSGVQFEGGSCRRLRVAIASHHLHIGTR